MVAMSRIEETAAIGSMSKFSLCPCCNRVGIRGAHAVSTVTVIGLAECACRLGLSAGLPATMPVNPLALVGPPRGLPSHDRIDPAA